MELASFVLVTRNLIMHGGILKALINGSQGA